MPYGCNVCVSSFQTFLISVGFKKSFLSLQKNYKNKFALLSCPVSPVPLLRFRFLPRLFRASLYRFAFLPHLFSFASLVSLFAAFSCSRFPCFVSQTLFILLFLFVSSAMFLLPRFSCSVFQSAKSLKKCFKNFYGLAKSVSRPYPYHIYSNFIQSYSKNQDSICFFSRLLLLLVLLLKRALY